MSLPDMSLPDHRPSEVEVVVADDEMDIRLLLTLQLRHAGFEVIGEAANGQEAIDVCEALRPHVLVLDLLMPVMNGFDAIPILQDRCPDLKIIAYSAIAGEFARTETDRFGVPLRLKNGDPEALIETIHQLTRTN